jgi:hypothetical protein
MMTARWVALCFASSLLACSSVNSSAGAEGSAPSVKLTKPHDGDSFALTADSMDIDVDFDVQNFELVQLGQEGTDMRKGQVRLYVDGDLCNDPGEMGQPALSYNKIWPNDQGQKHVGMDYCFGAPSGLDNTSHVLKAQLWHGEMALTQSSAIHQIRFKTTYSAEGGIAVDSGATSVDAGGE